MSIVPQASAAAASFSTAGSSVDLLNSEGPISVIYAVGSTTGTPSTLSVTFKLQYSLDNSTFSDYVSAGLDTTNALTAITTASTEVYGLYWHPPVGARYWKVVATVAFTGGSSPTVGVYAEIIRQKKVLGGNGSQGPVAIS